MMKKLVLVLLFCIPALQGCAPLVVGGAVAGGALVGQDRRTIGAITEDEAIELKASQRIGQSLPDAHVDVTSFNRVVLLTGEAPSEAKKAEAAAIINRDLANVRAIHNEITIAAASALSARSNDSYLTSKVKTRLIDVMQLDAQHVKVVTSNNVVYLMGLVTPQEAERAAEVTRTTAGVQRVVKVFEYIG
jgi:osmotically-inducible protein OsmY